MKINGTIFELLFNGKGEGDKDILHYDRTFYIIANDNIKRLFRYEDEIYTSIQTQCGLWISNKTQNITEHIDLFGLGGHFDSIPCTASDLYTRDNILLVITSGEFVKPDYILEQELLIIDTIKQASLKKGLINGAYVSWDEYCIYVRSNNEKLVECYDYDLNKQWQYTFEGQVYIDF